MIYRKAETVSTNLDARLGSPGDVFIADYQTAGRGRLNHKWLASKGENLTFSVVLSTGDKPPAEVATLSLVVGLAVAEAIKGRLKWPNDVYLGDKKVCGILCERHQDNVIAGIGINVNQQEFPIEIAERATSLAIVKGAQLNREVVLTAVLNSLFAAYDVWQAEGFKALYPRITAIDLLKGAWVEIIQTDDDKAPICGHTAGIDSDGALIVAGKRIYAGEAHIKEFS